jgi:hypothetical protein
MSQIMERARTACEANHPQTRRPWSKHWCFDEHSGRKRASIRKKARHGVEVLGKCRMPDIIGEKLMVSLRVTLPWQRVFLIGCGRLRNW